MHETSAASDDLCELLRRIADTGPALDLELSADWSQGSAVFGGLVAAIAVQAMRPLADPQRRLRSLSITFVGPVRPGRVTLAAESLRSGRSVSHVAARVVQHDQSCCHAVAAFAEAGRAAFTLPTPARPDAPPPADVPRMPFVPGFTPAYTRHFDYRVTVTAEPDGPSQLGGWCRLDESDSAPLEATMVALADAWPPTFWTQMGMSGRVFTMSWSLDLVHAPDPGDGWWFYRAATDGVADSFAPEQAMLWDPSGRLAVVSRRLFSLG